MVFEYLTVPVFEQPGKLTFIYPPGSKTENKGFQEFLNSVGTEGWELVTIMYLDSQNETHETVGRLIFKRQKE